MRIALVTAAQARNLDEDLPPLLSALAKRGVEAEPVDWDAPTDWSRYDLSIVRSTWDYVPRRDAFLAWAAHVPRLLNRAAVLSWNTDKRYLRDFAPLPVVPTTFVSPGDALPPLDGDLVIKPAISAGAQDTARHSDPRAALAHIESLRAAGRTVMIQPYVPGIDERGETALIYFNGAYSHAIRKAAILRTAPSMVGGLYAQESIAACEPTPDERALADRIMAAAPPDLLYARVDLIPGPMLLEFEATEPSVFLTYAPGSADRFADAILRRLT